MPFGCTVPLSVSWIMCPLSVMSRIFHKESILECVTIVVGCSEPLDVHEQFDGENVVRWSTCMKLVTARY